VELCAGWGPARRTIEIEAGDAIWRADLLHHTVLACRRQQRGDITVSPVPIVETRPILDRMYDEVLAALRDGQPPTVGADSAARAVLTVLAASAVRSA